MAPPADDLLFEVLKACARTAPEPLYPGTFAAYSGLERDLLDDTLDQLRLRGLVRITDWAQGKGQGYRLTPQGEMVLEDPRLIHQAAAPEPEAAFPEREMASSWDRGEAIRNALINPIRPIVTMTLLGLIVLVYLFGLSNPQLDATLKERGVLAPTLVLEHGQWWRLLSHLFLHVDLFHLIMNAYALYSLGPLLETIWGSGRFLVLYMIAGFGGGCAVVLGANPAIGASGALCGLITSLGVWVYMNRGHLPPQIVSSWLNTVFMNLVLMVIISTFPRVSWAGHLGGAVAGALVSIPLNFHRYGQGLQKLGGLIGILFVPLIGLAGLFYHLDSQPEPVRAKARLLSVFAQAEDVAAKTYNRHAGPLLRALNERQDNPATGAALQAFAEAQNQLREAIQAFDAAQQFKEPKVIESIARGRAYLNEWAQYYVLFSKTLDKALPLPGERIGALEAQLEQVMNAGKATKKTLFPSSYGQ